MAKNVRIGIIRARHDTNVPRIPAQVCISMLMTDENSVFRYWANTSRNHIDFADSPMFPWVDMPLGADTSRAAQAPNPKLLPGLDGLIVLTPPGNREMPNPKAGQPGQPATSTVGFDSGTTSVAGMPVAVLPVMTSDYTFMCHELGHVLGLRTTGFGGGGEPAATPGTVAWTVGGVPVAGNSDSVDVPFGEVSFAVEYTIDHIGFELALTSRGGERFEAPVVVTVTGDGVTGTARQAIRTRPCGGSAESTPRMSKSSGTACGGSRTASQWSPHRSRDAEEDCRAVLPRQALHIAYIDHASLVWENAHARTTK
jgi:hypothetical protein